MHFSLFYSCYMQWYDFQKVNVSKGRMDRERERRAKEWFQNESCKLWSSLPSFLFSTPWVSSSFLPSTHTYSFCYIPHEYDCTCWSIFEPRVMGLDKETHFKFELSWWKWRRNYNKNGRIRRSRRNGMNQVLVANEELYVIYMCVWHMDEDEWKVQWDRETSDRLTVVSKWHFKRSKRNEKMFYSKIEWNMKWNEEVWDREGEESQMNENKVQWDDRILLDNHESKCNEEVKESWKEWEV